MPHISGKKVAKKHSTVIEVAQPLLKAVLKLTEVEKVVNGEIAGIRNGPIRIKIEIIPAGLKLMVRGVNARQKIFVYTSSPEAVKAIIEKVWKK